MLLPTLADYQALRSRFTVSGEAARRALADVQPHAQAALGIHVQRQTLVEGGLPAHIVMTTAETNGGWGELMPVWFKAYERPVPLYCLDNWALFAALYRASFGPGDAVGFTGDSLLHVLLGVNLLMPFLPSTDGAGRFLRHGILPWLLAILWLEPDVCEAWLALHARGAEHVRARCGPGGNLTGWLERVEEEGWLVPERGLVGGEAAVAEFLADPGRAQPFADLLAGLCLTTSALVTAWGTDWRRWVFQAVNVGYRTPGFALAELAAWLGSGRPD